MLIYEVEDLKVQVGDSMEAVKERDIYVCMYE